MHEDAGNEVNYRSLFAAFHCRTIAAIMWNLHGAIISPAVGGDDAGHKNERGRGVCWTTKRCFW